MSILQLSQVHSHYQNVPVLNGVDLSLTNSEVLALLGPSGCGKTTLLKAIAGLQPIDHGSIRIDGQTVAADGVFVPSEQRNIGMIFQDYALFPHLSVADNIMFGLQGLNSEQKIARVDEMLALVKLDGLAKRFPHELSGGQQQRVAIARSLAYKPKLLLLDEPFSNIDSQVRSQLMMDIREILKTQNVSALFVTHSKEEAFIFADQIALFESGKLAQHGSAEQLYAQPQSRYVAGFLGDANYLPAEIIDGYSIRTPFGLHQTEHQLDLEQGAQMQLLVRPHQVTLKQDLGGQGQVISQRYQGTSYQYLIQAGGECLSATASSGIFKVGDRVGLSFELERFTLFA